MRLTPTLALIVLSAMLTVAIRSQTPVAPAAKIAIFDMQAALANTQDGKRAAADMQAKYDNWKARIDKKQSDVETLQERLRKAGATMNDDARAWLEHEIDAGTRAANHDAEDLQAEASLEQQGLARTLQTKMRAEVEKYAQENGFTAVFDVSGQQNQLLWSSPASNITQQVVARYEKSHPAAAPASQK